MAKRQVFFSFEYNKDAWRASQVRNMGKVDNSSTFSDNDWEEVKEKTDAKIREWIDNQMAKRSCLVVLIGATTSGRKWINYEIEKDYCGFSFGNNGLIIGCPTSEFTSLCCDI